MAHKIRKNENFKAEKSILWIFFWKSEVFTDTEVQGCRKEHFLHMQKKISSWSDPLFFYNHCKSKKSFQKKTRLKFRETFDWFDDYIPLLKTFSRIIWIYFSRASSAYQYVAVQQSFFFLFGFLCFDFHKILISIKYAFFRPSTFIFFDQFWLFHSWLFYFTKYL